MLINIRSIGLKMIILMCFICKMSLLYYIKVQYNNISFYAMVDCGAQISIMSLTMVKKLGIKDKDIKPTNGVVKGIGQTTMLGKVKNCPLSIVNCTTFIPIVIDFIVLQNNNLIILGLDFLEKYKCIINCNFKMLHMNGNKVPLINHPIKQPIKPKPIVKKPVSKKTKPKVINK